jgi:glyoxylase-like metal-dependent hydrolase (beta-lactamase superfamily II)
MASVMNIESARMLKYETVGEGILAVDTDYVRPRMDASHLIVDSGRAAFVDTGTNHSAPNLQAALLAQDLEPTDVDYIFLTHVHLDHAGGTGLLAQLFPRAQILVHPRGAGHIVDPSKLIAGTRAVYGDDAYLKLYGDILAVPKERVTSMQDGERCSLGRRTFEFLHTPGHAMHHLSIVDRSAAAVFSGDTFGVSYREFDTARGEFVIATTTPTQFDPDQLHASVDRILGTKPAAIYMTHYSRVNAIERLGNDMHADIDRYVAIARRHVDAADRQMRIRDDLYEHVEARLAAHGFGSDRAQIRSLLGTDVDLNAAGLVAWLQRAH